MILLLLLINYCDALTWTSAEAMSMSGLKDAMIIHARKGVNIVLRCESNSAKEVLITDSMQEIELWSAELIGNKSVRYANVHVPRTDFEAYKMNERVLSCRDGSAESQFVTFEVDFNPFCDSRVKKVQTGGVVECPIRAPSRFYSVVWSLYGRDGYSVLYAGNSSRTSYYYYVGRDEGVFMCTLMHNGVSVHSANITHFNLAEPVNILLPTVCVGSFCSVVLFVDVIVIQFICRKKRSA